MDHLVTAYVLLSFVLVVSLATIGKYYKDKAYKLLRREVRDRMESSREERLSIWFGYHFLCDPSALTDDGLRYFRMAKRYIYLTYGVMFFLMLAPIFTIYVQRQLGFTLLD